MDRRKFLQISSLSASALAADLVGPTQALAARKENPEKYVRLKGFSILQGVTNEESFQLSIDVPKNMKVHFELRNINDPSRVIAPFYLKTASRSSQEYRVDKIGYTKLPYLGRFVFQVRDQAGQVLDERFVNTLDTHKAKPRIALMSCMNESSINIKPIWEEVAKAQCDMMFFFGDAVYGDTLLIFSSPDMLWEKYIATRQAIPFYRWKTLVPVLAVWDDHDYGLNNSDGNYKHKKESMATFRAFFPQEPIINNYKLGPGVSGIFRAFEQKFIFLDNRWFKNLKNNGANGFLGPEQINWAIKELNIGHEPNWIIEGSQFFQNGKECYLKQNRAECSGFAKLVGGLNSPSAFVSGDVHYTEVSRVPRDLIGYDTIEITSSCLHSTTVSSPPSNPLRMKNALRENFVLLEILPAKSVMPFNLTCIGIGKINFQEKYSIG